MKRYRLKTGESVALSIGSGVVHDGNGKVRDHLASLQLHIKEMTRFDWLYGEEMDYGEKTDNEIILHIPYPLPYISFRIPVPKNMLEEIPE